MIVRLCALPLLLLLCATVFFSAAVERLEPVVIDGREFIAARIGSQDMS